MIRKGLATAVLAVMLVGGLFPALTQVDAQEATPASDSDLEANKALVLRYESEVWDKGNTDVVFEVLAEDFTWRFAISEVFLIGPESVKMHADTLDRQIEGMGLTVDLMVAEGNMVAIRWTFTSTPEATPTVTTVLCTGNDFFRIENGKLAELWSESVSCA
jgi:hypothetical protein